MEIITGSTPLTDEEAGELHHVMYRMPMGAVGVDLARLQPTTARPVTAADVVHVLNQLRNEATAFVSSATTCRDEVKWWRDWYRRQVEAGIQLPEMPLLGSEPPPPADDEVAR